MPRILSLDLGSASLGWALIDTSAKSIADAGVRIFPEGVDRDQQGGELSKSEQRRVARGMRRQIARRARRKKVLRAALVQAGLYPSDPKEQDKWHSINPYPLRARAVHERLEPFEIGRILIHLNQRRGFLANRKTDRTTKKVQSEMLTEISDLGQRIAEHGGTLGSLLAQGVARPGEPATSSHRVRNQHTHRQMLLSEFDAIWDKQRGFHPSLLTDRLKYGARGAGAYPTDPIHRGKRSPLEAFGLHGIMFFQRPMYWPREAIGFCELLTRKRRCPRADRLAQRCRIYQEVNNLRLIEGASERELAPDERAKLVEYLIAARERTFDEIRKHLGFAFPEQVRFNLERAVSGDNISVGRSKLKGMETDAILSNKHLFGNGWHQREEAEKDAIVRMLLDPALQEKTLFETATRRWGLNAAQAERLVGLELPQGYAKFSRDAFEKLEPHLRRGLPLMRNDAADGAMPNDAIHAAGLLPPHERNVEPLDELPEPPDLPNPLVCQALFELRCVVNAIIRKYGKPNAIHIELAREIKGSLEKRRRTRLEQFAQEQRRAAAAQAIRELNLGVHPNRANINRYLLWQEQGEVCIYTGRTIPPEKLFGGEIDIDHILPYPRSLDDSMANRVVCYRYANQQKGDQTPYEWLAEPDPQRYEEALQRAKKLRHFGKHARFLRKNVELGEFIERQLVDTSYISRAAVQYVKQLGVDVLGTKGQYTAHLRWLWGLDTVLRHDELPVKNREDHRHHAVDAIVIALTDRRRLRKLAELRRAGEDIPVPWPSFREDAEAIINKVNVSHRVQRGVRGALHEETIYGPTEQQHVYVRRYDLAGLTPEMVTRIRDDVARQKVIERLQAHGIAIGRGGVRIPASVWQEPLWMNERKGISIKKVRVCKPEESVVGIRPGADGEPSAYVKPGSLHHLCIFEFPNGKKTRREAIFTSMLEAARRRRAKEPLIRRVHPTRPDARFIVSLSRGEAVIGPKGGDQLMIFNTAASTQGQIYFHHHTDARPANKKQKFVVTANSMSRDARKVTVDPLGRIRSADRFKAAESLDLIDNRIAEIAKVLHERRMSNSKARERLRELGLTNFGAQLTAARHLLRMNG